MDITRFEFSLFGINTYAVVDPDTKDCAIIDPGMSDDEERKAVENFITNNNLNLTHIINTHLHIDHAIGNGWLRKKYAPEILAHRDDMILGRQLRQQAAAFGIPMEVDEVEVTRFLEPGEIIRIGNGELKVIHVPGHSKGSIALYDAKDGFLISGDALFAGSIGRTDLPGGSMPQLLSSIKDNLFTLPADTIVYPGHGPATTIGHELRTNPFFK